MSVLHQGAGRRYRLGSSSGLLWRVQFALHLGLSRTGTPQSLLLYAGLLYYYSCGHIIQAVCMRAVQWLYLCVGLWVDLGRSPR